MNRLESRIAFQGVLGAYSQAAILQHVGSSTYDKAVPCTSFEECFKAMKEGRADYALLPVENNVGGYIHEIWELMLRYSGYVLDETEFRVRHCLLSLPGVKKEDIKYVISHPQALAQCEEYSRKCGFQQQAHYDTAGSAKTLAEEKIEHTAAIASSVAASIYGLHILEEGIEDDSTNHTRFLLVSLQESQVDLASSGPCRFYATFVLAGETHDYFQAVQLIRQYSGQLVRLDSRPLRKYAAFIFGQDKETMKEFLQHFDTFAYIHFFDVTTTFEQVKPLAEALQSSSRFFRTLGVVKMT
eukprot:TRINITY_DN2525_c0_g4_i4.p1 TRINITY_DN2525_c0_g4~~TRINITY_DN2525_c0_g4_i4.p1  ORF type:complete len:299 (-),score=53.04 TRINITY_DN2525_c0_g4_i4:55-951(-)